MDNYKMFASVLELSETDTYIELKRRSCYYNHPNLNGVQLDYDDSSLEIAETLVNQPVVAKYKRIAGKDDLGGHEFSIDSDGNVNFDTANIGVNTEVKIEDDDVVINGETISAPCLFVTSRVWKRNKNICSAIKRLFDENCLHSSWEILTSRSETIDGVKHLREYVFEADCLLGSRIIPAYGSCATTLEISSVDDDYEMLIAEALANDIYNNQEKEECVEMSKKIENGEEVIDKSPVVSGIENKEGEKDPDLSSLTAWDLRNKIQTKCREKVNWCWIVYMFPEEHYVLAEPYERESELDYLKFDYTVVDDDVTVGDPVEVRLTVSIKDVNEVIASKDDAIIKANNTINTLQTQISELEPFKLAYEKAEKERLEAEKEQKRKDLSEYALKSNRITKEELETDENIKTMISELNESGIKALIADRVVASLNNEVETKTEVVDHEKFKTPKSDLSEVNDVVDYKKAVRSFLGK